MINILYTKVDKPLPDMVFFKYLEQVPQSMRNKILMFHKWQDRYSSLYGKLLLQEGLKRYGLKNCSLTDIKYNEYHRPFFDCGIDFNISHSGEYVLCAISSDARLGIDIEQIKKIELDDFKSFFTTLEWESIATSGSSKYEQFYFYWTRKEAVLKANGKGLTFPLQNLCMKNDKIILEAERWKLMEVKIGDVYMCHLASSEFKTEVALNEIAFNNQEVLRS